MQFPLIITSLFALAVIAAPTPSPAPGPSCNAHCCQSLQNPDNMSKLLVALAIARSDITGMMGIGCTPGECPSSIVGVPSCCSGATMGRVVTSGCAPLKW